MLSLGGLLLPAFVGGLISGPELVAVLETANGFTTSTVIYDQAQGVHLRLVPRGGQ